MAVTIRLVLHVHSIAIRGCRAFSVEFAACAAYETVFLVHHLLAGSRFISRIAIHLDQTLVLHN